MSEIIERVAQAISEVQLWTRFNDWTSDRVPGKPIEVCRYGKEGEPEIIVLDRFPADWDEKNEFPKLISEHRARAAIEATGLIGALDALAQVHIKDDDPAGFSVKMGAIPEFWYYRQPYVNAWGTVHKALREFKHHR